MPIIESKIFYLALDKMNNTPNRCVQMIIRGRKKMQLVVSDQSIFRRLRVHIFQIIIVFLCVSASWERLREFQRSLVHFALHDSPRPKKQTKEKGWIIQQINNAWQICTGWPSEHQRFQESSSWAYIKRWFHIKSLNDALVINQRNKIK